MIKLDWLLLKQKYKLKNSKDTPMEIAIWDTYVTRKDGKKMHFDILVDQDVTDENQIFEYGKQYLKSIGQEGQTLTANECEFCHIGVVSSELEVQILKEGFSIIEIENCN